MDLKVLHGITDGAVNEVINRLLRQLCTDSEDFQLKHEKCSGYVDYDEKEQKLECRYCHKVSYIR